MWAAGLYAAGELRLPTLPSGAPNANAALGAMVSTLIDSPVLAGLLTAGILAAIMSSLDSQFVCLGTMFTNDIVARLAGHDRFTDRQMVWLARGFVVAVVAVAYGLSMWLIDTNVFDLGVWCFTGFGCLFPLVFAALYWRRTTRAGAIACVLATAATWAVFFTDDVILKGRNLLGDAGHGEYLVMGVMPAVFIFTASVTSLVVVSLLTRPPQAQTINKFFAVQQVKPNA
jgi:SSS family solute:Na+ symporter